MCCRRNNRRRSVAIFSNPLTWARSHLNAAKRGGQWENVEFGSPMLALSA